MIAVTLAYRQATLTGPGPAMYFNVQIPLNTVWRKQNLVLRTKCLQMYICGCYSDTVVKNIFKESGKHAMQVYTTVQVLLLFFFSN